MTADDRAHFHLQHPDPYPDITGDLPYPIDPPGKLCRTSSWLRYRDETLLPLLRGRPDDSYLPRLLQQAEAVLAWRAGPQNDQRFCQAEQVPPGQRGRSITPGCGALPHALGKSASACRCCLRDLAGLGQEFFVIGAKVVGETRLSLRP